jgi:hypothetical protein
MFSNKPSIKRLFLFILVVLLATVPAFAQKPDDTEGTILPGPRISFVLKEPPGWVLDTKTGRGQGIEAVLFNEGSSWRNAVAVMYARVIDKDASQDTVEKVIGNDIAEFMKLSAQSVVSDSPAIQTRDKRQAVVKVFYDAANKNYESVAFIDDKRVVVILALSSRDKAAYEKALPAFQALVGSYLVFTPLTPPE